MPAYARRARAAGGGSQEHAGYVAAREAALRLFSHSDSPHRRAILNGFMSSAEAQRKLVACMPAGASAAFKRGFLNATHLAVAAVEADRAAHRSGDDTSSMDHWRFNPALRGAALKKYRGLVGKRSKAHKASRSAMNKAWWAGKTPGASTAEERAFILALQKGMGSVSRQNPPRSSRTGRFVKRNPGAYRWSQTVRKVPSYSALTSAEKAAVDFLAAKLGMTQARVVQEWGYRYGKDYIDLAKSHGMRSNPALRGKRLAEAQAILASGDRARISELHKGYFRSGMTPDEKKFVAAISGLAYGAAPRKSRKNPPRNRRGQFVSSRARRNRGRGRRNPVMIPF